MTTLFAFLGTNDYVPVHYELEGRRTELPEAFTQAAFVQLLEPRPTRVCVATTRSARGVGSKRSESETSNWDRLTQRLSELGYTTSQGTLASLEIDDGASEDELWNIFEKLGAIGSGEIVFDCTHGFRTLPLVAALALPYHGTQRGFVIKRVLYGAFEALGSPRDVRSEIEAGRQPGPAPVFDLSAMLDIPVWHQAINEFRHHGRARGLEARLGGPANELGRQLGKQAPVELRRLPKSLARLSDLLSITKVDDISSAAVAALDVLDLAARQIDVHPLARRLRPFASIVEALREIITPLSAHPDDGPYDAALRLARWYADREQYTACYTTLRETVTDHLVGLARSYGIERIASDKEGELKWYAWSASRFRMAVDGWFFRIAKDNSSADDTNPTSFGLIAQSLARDTDLRDRIRAVDAMIDRRNRLNHAFKGESAATRVDRSRETGRLGLHDDALADIELVEQLVGGAGTARAKLGQDGLR